MSNRRLALDAWESLFRAQHELFNEFAVDFACSELTQPEYDVLLTVTRGADHTARLREITANALISQPSVSRLVDRMVASGLLTKHADPEDGRGFLLTATEDGVRRFRLVSTAHGRHIAERMAALSPEDLTLLLDLTRRLRAG